MRLTTDSRRLATYAIGVGAQNRAVHAQIVWLNGEIRAENEAYSAVFIYGAQS